MKEFISILFMIVSGVVLYGIFSTRNVDAASSVSIAPSGTSVNHNMKYQCYGSLTVNGNSSTLPMNCSGAVSSSQSCPSNSFLVGWTYQIVYTNEETTWSNCNMWDCSNYWQWEEKPTGSACTAVCATMASPVTNCGWH
jgi:hypothetical protein